MSSLSSSDESEHSEQGAAGVVEELRPQQPWSLEPRRVRRVQPVQEVARAVVEEDPDLPYPRWCQCGKCHRWTSPRMNVCCQNHDIWLTKEEDDPVQCITETEDLHDLLRPAPVKVMFRNYCSKQPQRKPDSWKLKPNDRWSPEDILKLRREQQRLASYRSVVFHTWETLPPKERRPIPSCVYMMIRALYPPTNSDEDFAAHEFSVFVENIRPDED